MGEMGNSGSPVWRISCDCLNSVMRTCAHWTFFLMLGASLLIVSCTQPTLAPVPTPNETQIAALEARISQLETEQTALETAEGKLSQREVRITELEAMISQLETEKAALTTLEDKLSQKETRIAELEAMISQLETESSQLETEQTAPATAESEFSQEIVEKARAVGIEARKSVVYLEIQKEDGFGQATAWFLEGGLLITAGHVVEGAVTIKGHTIDGDTFSVEVINWSHIPVDVAVLRTDYTKAPGLPVGSSGGLKEGDPLVQVGHPGGMGNWVMTLGKFVRSIFSSKPVTFPSTGDKLVGTVPGSGGVSGSPVLTLDGKVVGITTGSRTVEEGVIGPGVPPSDSEIYQSLEELRPSLFSLHVSIERALEQVAEWTE